MKNIFMEVGAAWLEKRKNLPGDPLGEIFLFNCARFIISKLSHKIIEIL